MQRKAQSTLEYAVIIAVVAGGLLAMNFYMKRGVQGKLRSSADSIGEQYSAGITTSKFETTQEGESVAKEYFGFNKDGTAAVGHSAYVIDTPAKITRKTLANETVTKNVTTDGEKVIE